MCTHDSECSTFTFRGTGACSLGKDVTGTVDDADSTTYIMCADQMTLQGEEEEDGGDGDDSGKKGERGFVFHS